jgi:NAD(P)-dependent dehydrogenase (short-subunit alcohol dehydrogenase family)
MSERPTVLVTGGASGIGLAIVRAVLAEGWRAIAADLDSARLAQCRGVLGAPDDALRLAPLDVTDEDAVRRCVAACEAEFGPITGLVNSAGIGADVPALETGADLFRKILDVNLVGSFVTAREVAKHMRARGAGAIVNISSVSGIAGNQGRVAYGASKAGVNSMTQVMAVELAPLGIRVNAVAPGPVDTPLARAVHTPATRAAWIANIPQRRYGAAEEIAGPTIFLLDARKSGFVTGQTLCVDGGFTSAGFFGAASNG